MDVNGVDLNKVDKLHLARVAAQVGVKAPPGASTQRLIEELGKIFARTPASLSGPCDNCGGMSDSALSECPFCGIGEDDDDDEVQESPTQQAHAKLWTPTTGKSLQAFAAPVEVLAAATTGEQKLNAALAEIETLKANATVNLWKLGRKIKEIYDATLWMQRSDKGKPAHKSFDAFVHHELKGMSKTTAYWLMDIAEAFDEKEVLLYGRTKLGMILRAPKEDRSLLLDKVKAGIPVRALSEEVDKARAAKGEFVRETARGVDVTGRDQSAQLRGKAKQKKARKAKGDSITIAKTFGRQQVKLWCHPEKKGAEPTKRARKLTDKPYGVFDLDNGVQMHFGITSSSAGDWILVVETKRPSS